MAERRPGKSVIPDSLYWDLLKPLVCVYFFLGGCSHLSLQLGSFADYLWDHIFLLCPICCLRTLGPNSKPVCRQGRKCLLTAMTQALASHCSFQNEYRNLPSCLGLMAYVLVWTKCQQSCILLPKSLPCSVCICCCRREYPKTRLTVRQWVQLPYLG